MEQQSLLKAEVYYRALLLSSTTHWGGSTHTSCQTRYCCTEQQPRGE